MKLFEDKELRIDRYHILGSDHIRFFWWGNQFVQIWQTITKDEWWFYQAWTDTRVPFWFDYVWEWHYIPVLDWAPYIKTFGRDATWEEACDIVAKALENLRKT